MAEGDEKWTFINEQIIGNGSFGLVYQAEVKGSGDKVAIKKVLQDKRFKVGAHANAAHVLLM